MALSRLNRRARASSSTASSTPKCSSARLTTLIANSPGSGATSSAISTLVSKIPRLNAVPRDHQAPRRARPSRLPAWYPPVFETDRQSHPIDANGEAPPDRAQRPAAQRLSPSVAPPPQRAGRAHWRSAASPEAQPLLPRPDDSTCATTRVLEASSHLRSCVRTDLDSAGMIRRANEEKHHAHQQNPRGKHKLCPLQVGGCYQKHQSDQVSQVRDPARQPGGSDSDGTHRDGEHRRHPHCVDGEESLADVPPVREDVGVEIRFSDQRQQTGRGSRPHEQHRQKKQPAAHENRGEEPILDLPELLAHYTDEPQEGDPGKWHQAETEPDQAAPLRVGLKRKKATFGQGDAQHDHRRQEQHSEDYSRDRRRAPTPEASDQARRRVSGHIAQSPGSAGVASSRYCRDMATRSRSSRSMK